MNTFSEALKYRRVAAGKTQVDLSRVTGIAQSTIAKFESGSSEPTPVYRYALRCALGLPEGADDGWWRVDW